MRLKGVQPPLPFGEKTRDCSPGHAGKEGPQLARTGASQGILLKSEEKHKIPANGGGLGGGREEVAGDT